MYTNTEAYKNRVRDMLNSPTDLWGEHLMAQPEGPTYEAIEGLLHPLLFVGRKPCEHGWLTDSSIYYLPFGLMDHDLGGKAFALHVADGSQIISDHFEGRKCTLFVGPEGNERYGSCLENLDGPRLASGFLPILQNSYVDASGLTYQQESFATRIIGIDSLVSMVRLQIGPSVLAGAVKIVIDPADSNLSWRGNCLIGPDGTHYVFSPGATFDGERVTYTLQPSATSTQEIVFLRLNNPAICGLSDIDENQYRAARECTETYWQERLDRGTVFAVPEPLVMDAQKNLIIQNLLMNWKYSIGNLYETEFNAESSDSIEALALFGHGENYKAGIQKMIDGPNEANWEKGTRLKHVARYYHLTGDSSLAVANHAVLLAYAEDLAQQTMADVNGLLRPELGGTDISDPDQRFYSLHFQVDCWRGLRDMAVVWGQMGYPELEEKYSRIAADFQAAIRRAVEASKVELDDSSLFVPVSLLDQNAKKPYDPITATTEGSYWLLVAPNSYAPGFFQPGSESEAILRYLHNYGAILMGMLRFNYLGIPVGSCKVHGWTGMRSSGVDNVYAVSYAKFLADNDQADRLVMTLYGKLAHGMTRDTFVSAEGEEVDVCGDDYFRSMYLPPNSTNNSLFLHTLRLMLVRETTDDRGIAQDLHLAAATPRGWLEAGKKIQVQDAPTLFGPISYTIESHLDEGFIDVQVDISRDEPIAGLYLRLRTPGQRKIKDITVGGTPAADILLDDETLLLQNASGKLEIRLCYETNLAQL